MKDGGNPKRRRISPSSGVSLRDLPNEALSFAASFVARPSRAMFAIAVGGDDELSSIILGEQFGVLDFGEVEKTLAAKITDDHLQKILVSINANTNLKRLKIAGCINITGAGLDPLRGSIVLQQIDLGLVAEHKSPVLDSEPRLSRENVLPILGSIIERDDSALKHLTFPMSWREIEGRNTALREFMERCNQMFERRNVRCTKCDKSVDEDANMWFPLAGNFYGRQGFTCYTCTTHFCYCCDDDGGKNIYGYCELCEKEYCRECGPIDMCDGCDRKFCKECKSMEECGDCANIYCEDCEPMEKCGGSPEGRRCDEEICGGCVNEDERCGKCDKPFCDSCWEVHRCNSCNRGYCGDCGGGIGTKMCNKLGLCSG